MRLWDIEEYIRDRFQVGLRANQVYYWEQKGLLGNIKRTENKRRNYTEADVEKIVVIFMLSQIHLSIRTIKKIVVENDTNAKEIALEKIALLKEDFIPELQKYLTQ